MNWFAWLIGGPAWLAVSAIFFARRCARLEGDALVVELGMLLPPFFLISCLGYFALSNGRDGITERVVLLVHHTSIATLFLFLAAAEYLQLEAVLRINRAESRVSITNSVRRLWALTEVAPGAIAPVILLTGLHLIWESPQVNVPSQVWLLTIVFGFGLFFFDGLMGYRSIVRAMYGRWRALAELDQGAPAPLQRLVPFSDGAQLLVHFASWPILFSIGLSRLDFPNPISAAVKSSAQTLAFLPAGWPEVTVALAVVALAGALVLVLRAALWRMKRSPASLA